MKGLIAIGLTALGGIGVLAWSPDQPDLSNGESVGFRMVGEPVPVGLMPTTPLLTDLDADGDIDVIVVCGPCCGREVCEDSGHVQVLLNDGDGRLTKRDERIRLGGTALGGATGDVNGDGHVDVVVHHHSSYDAAVLLGDGAGGLRLHGYTPLHDGESAHVHSIALADVNGDGHLDMLATLVDDHALAVLLGDGEGGFVPALGQPYFAQQHPYAQLNTVDINGDGAIDAVLTDMRGNGMTVLAGSGTGMFAPLLGFNLNTSMPLSSAERPMACALGDVDGDGDLDAVTFIDESPIAVLMINEGGGVYAEAPDALIDLGAPCVGGTLADVTGDGVLDVVASGTVVTTVSIVPGKRGGGFGKPRLIEAGGLSPHVAVADMNGDGRLDLVTGNYDGGTIGVLTATRSAND